MRGDADAPDPVPHLTHNHVIVPYRHARTDGELASIDSKACCHEAKAAGRVQQAIPRHCMQAERGFEWAPVDEHSGFAEIAGVTLTDVIAWPIVATPRAQRTGEVTQPAVVSRYQ